MIVGLQVFADWQVPLWQLKPEQQSEVAVHVAFDEPQAGADWQVPLWQLKPEQQSDGAVHVAFDERHDGGGG